MLLYRFKAAITQDWRREHASTSTFLGVVMCNMCFVIYSINRKCFSSVISVVLVLRASKSLKCFNRETWMRMASLEEMKLL